jgi:CubicO group peptidase (beta-lactamase class C family)
MSARAEERVDRIVRAHQAEERLPSVAAAVVRRGELVWSTGVGAAGADGEAPTPDTQYRIGSITKTFTAVLVMQLRDAGELDLDAPLSTYLPGTKHTTLTPRRMLCHLSGLQREPVGDVWATFQLPDREQLVAGLEDAEAVLPPNRRWHYSNLTFALLGEVVARTVGAPWEDVLFDRVLRPLGMTRTTPAPEVPVAQGYLVDPYADVLHAEPVMRGGGIAPAAELWSTPADLARWASFLAAPDEAVLAPATVEEMCHLHAMADLERWSLGWGLGLMLYRRGDRVLVGHGGAMPGFLAGLAVARADGIGAVAFTNNTSRGDMEDLACRLVETWLEEAPDAVEPWSAGEKPPELVASMLGRWWSEGSEFVFTWSGNQLQAKVVGAPAHKPPAVFEPIGDDRWRTVSGREQGEVLRVVRAGSDVVEMYWATYLFTRTIRTFGPR